MLQQTVSYFPVSSQRASQVTLVVKNPSANAGDIRDADLILVMDPDPLEEGMATHSSILTWRIPWTEESGRLWFVGLQRVGHDKQFSMHTLILTPETWNCQPFLPSCPAPCSNFGTVPKICSVSGISANWISHSLYFNCWSSKTNTTNFHVLRRQISLVRGDFNTGKMRTIRKK